MSELLKSILGMVNPVGAQREQINLLTLEKSQLVSLIGEMQSEIQNLGAKVSNLETENTNLKIEIQRRDDVIQKEKSHIGRLEEVREKILVLLSQHEELEPEEISSHLNIGVQLAKFHLEELQKSKFVRDYWAVGSPVYYGIIQDGRAYLVSHGLLA